MSTESNSLALHTVDFVVKRTVEKIQDVLDEQIKGKIPGLRVVRIATRQTELLYRATTTDVRNFVLLGIALQTFNQEIQKREATSNRQLEKTPTAG